MITMSLPIDDEYRIASDGVQYMIQKHLHATEKREEGFQSVGYYSSLQGAVQGLSERMLRESDAHGVIEVYAAMKRITATLTDALTPQFEVKVKQGEQK